MRENERPVAFVPLVRLRNLLWLPVIGAGAVVGVAFGSPHLRVRYTYSGTYAKPYYLACDYWGLAPFRLLPPGGECPLFVFARNAEGGAR